MTARLARTACACAFLLLVACSEPEAPQVATLRVEPALFEIEVPAIGPFDSSVPVVAMCELLVAQVAKDLHDDATNRIDRIEALWERTEAFL